MAIVNKRERLNTRWRFWLGYIVSLLAVSLTVYFTLRASETEARSGESDMERMQKRDAYWEQLATLALDLNALKDKTQLVNPTTAVFNEIVDLRSRIKKQIESMQIAFSNAPSMEYPDKVLKGFINYSQLMEALDEQIDKMKDEITESEQRKCEDEKNELKRDHKDIVKDLKRDIEMLKMQNN